jgi:multidrug efflux pump subunit AcrA (membrane-fusion protein)
VGGRLEPRVRTVHKTLQGGLVEQIYVERGDRVTSGQPLFSVIQNDPGSRFRPIVVASRLDGIVSELLIDEKDEVSPGIPAVVVLDTAELTLKAVASDLDAFSLRTGIPVTGLSTDGETFRGILSHVSSEPDYQTGLFTLTFSFSSRGGARVGMPLFIDIPVEEVEGVFVEPDAVVRRYGRNRIWIVTDEGTLESREVVTGPVVGSRLQILAGLQPEEAYLNNPSGSEEEGMALNNPGAGT